MKTGKILLGVLAGAVTGAALGILFAPAKGSKTRHRIKRKGVEYKDAVKDQFNKIVENVSDRYEHAKEDISDFVSRDHHNKKEEVKK